MSFLPDCIDTHSAQHASTVLVEHNLFGLGSIESDEEDEGAWHDDVTSKETTGRPTRHSEAMAIEVCTAQSEGASLRINFQRALWQSDSISSGHSSQNTHKSGDTDIDDLATDVASGDVAPTATAMPKWPADTDMIFSLGRNRICLTNQQSMVRLVLQDAIENVHAFLAFRHAFPDSHVVYSCTKAALVNAAHAHFPGAAVIHNRLLSDEEYFLNMGVIVSTRNLVTTYLTFLIAASSDSDHPKWYQGALQCYGCG